MFAVQYVVLTNVQKCLKTEKISAFGIVYILRNGLYNDIKVCFHCGLCGTFIRKSLRMDVMFHALPCIDSIGPAFCITIPIHRAVNHNHTPLPWCVRLTRGGRHTLC